MGYITIYYFIAILLATLEMSKATTQTNTFDALSLDYLGSEKPQIVTHVTGRERNCETFYYCTFVLYTCPVMCSPQPHLLISETSPYLTSVI
jgi:hypothetical protein